MQPPPTTKAALLAALFTLLGGCADSRPSGNSLGGTLTLQPGGTVLCNITPCSVSLVLPPADGELTVLSGTFAIGQYPAGQTVKLGSFYNPQVFIIKDSGLPPAYFYTRA
jgi:hypothetical protein